VLVSNTTAMHVAVGLCGVALLAAQGLFISRFQTLTELKPLAPAPVPGPAP